MSILIKNGRIVTATDNYLADIFIEGEVISAIGNNLNVTADEIIDANGLLVMPGGIDPHVHLDMPLWEPIAVIIMKQELVLLYMEVRQLSLILFYKLKEKVCNLLCRNGKVVAIIMLLEITAFTWQ